MSDWVDIGRVKMSVSLEAVLRHYHVLDLCGSRDPHKGRCPIHQGKREDSFRASLSRNVFYCFACHARGNVLDFVAAMEKCSIRQAALYLQRWFGPVQPSGPAAAGQKLWRGGAKGELVREKEERNPPLWFALSGVDPCHPYLAERRVEPATALLFGIGFYSGPGLMSRRIAIPICNIRGEVVAYAGRAVDGGHRSTSSRPVFGRAWSYSISIAPSRPAVEQ